jgi:hypothetical protein
MFFVNATIDRLVWTAEHADAVGITPFPTAQEAVCDKPCEAQPLLGSVAVGPTNQDLSLYCGVCRTAIAVSPGVTCPCCLVHAS